MKVDVKVSQLLDKLVFTPDDRSKDIEIRNKLSIKNPGVKFTRGADGFSVNAWQVHHLILDGMDIDFRWTDLAKVFLDNRVRSSKYMPDVIDKVKRIRDGGETVAKEYLKGRPGFNVLDGHQWVNVSCMTLLNSCGLCVFDEQGAGKTVTMIFAFDELVERDEVDFAIILAPKSMVSEWPVDFKKFMGDRFTVQTLSGNAGEKRILISRSADVFVTNFETAILMEQEISALLRKYRGRGVLVVDESFFVKNLDAKRTQVIRRLREYCDRAFVLCGTPAPNSPQDLVQQFNIVDFGLTFRNVQLPKDKAEAAKIIQRTIEEKGPFVRNLKVNVLPGLPGKTFKKVPIQMRPSQADMYKKFSENLKSDLDQIDDATFEKSKISYLARRSALLQICSNPAGVDKEYRETPAKMLEIDKFLEDLISGRKEKVILWSFYTATLSALFDRYTKYNPVRYDGTITDVNVRREAVRSFRDDKDVMLFIGNPAAAGAGLNLQSARIAIYESMSNQAAHYLQSLDRIHRRGQDREVEYIVLLCEDTLEYAEYDRLLTKERNAQDLLGDNKIDQFTRKTLISELRESSQK